MAEQSHNDISNDIQCDMDNDQQIEEIMLSIDTSEMEDQNELNDAIEQDNLSSAENTNSLEDYPGLPNLCVECGRNLGPINPRQYCGKTFCMFS